MSEYKYTKGGKKVVVVGKLNSEETIVQEVFVSEGQEFPGGENFVVKGLLDVPAETWASKRTKELEANLKTLQDKYNQEYDRINKERNTTLRALEAVTKQLKAVTKTINLEAFEMVEKFLLGKYKYIFYRNPNPRIEEFGIDDAVYYDSYRGNERFDGVKLVSLMGRSNGDLGFRIHRWSDGSGKDSEDVEFYETKEEAISALGRYIESQPEYSSDLVKALKLYNIEPNKEKLIKYYQARKVYALKHKTELGEKYMKADDRLSEIVCSLAELTRD